MVSTISLLGVVEGRSSPVPDFLNILKGPYLLGNCPVSEFGLLTSGDFGVLSWALALPPPSCALVEL